MGYSHEEDYSDALSTLNNARLRYTNLSMTFFGNISEIFPAETQHSQMLFAEDEGGPGQAPKK
jgi:hypothetical protein